jgi:putative tricarboxylic transport membrane protein
MRLRTELILAFAVIAAGVFLLSGALRVSAGAGYDRIGPRFFPVVVATGFLALGGWYAVSTWWNRGPTVGLPPERWQTSPVSWQPFGYLIASFVLLVVMLEPVGFVIASSLQFWLVTRAFGSRTRRRDAVMAVVVALTVYLAFSRGLGLALPGFFSLTRDP